VAEVEGATEPRYRVAYEITARDAHEAAMLAQPWLRRGQGIAGAVAVLSGLTVLALELRALGPVFGWVFIVAGAILLIDTIWPVIELWRLRRILRAAIGKPGVYEFGSTGIDWATPLGEGHIPWTAVTEIRRNGRVIVGMLDRIPGWYAPITALGTEAECAEIVAYIEQQMTGANSA
jgi:hypothetical protein